MAATRSTTSEVQDGNPAAALVGRRIALVLFLLLVLLDLGGALGVSTGTVDRTAGGYTLQVEYPATGRAGLDVRWRVQVTHPGGFADELTIAVTGAYFDIFETQGFFPEPSAQTRDDKVLYLTFDAPPGESFTLDYDAYIQPASQRGHQAHVAVLAGEAGSAEIVGVDYTTRLVP